MREPSIEGKPFSQCKSETLFDSLLRGTPVILAREEDGPTSLEYEVDIAKRYAAILVREQS